MNRFDEVTSDQLLANRLAMLEAAVKAIADFYVPEGDVLAMNMRRMAVSVMNALDATERALPLVQVTGDDKWKSLCDSSMLGVIHDSGGASRISLRCPLSSVLGFAERKWRHFNGEHDAAPPPPAEQAESEIRRIYRTEPYPPPRQPEPAGWRWRFRESKDQTWRYSERMWEFDAAIVEAQPLCLAMHFND